MASGTGIRSLETAFQSIWGVTPLQTLNEIRLDANEEWLYVAETTAKRVTRLRVLDDGELYRL